MATNEVSTGFSAYSPRRLERLAFGAFNGAGIDQFTDPTAQNPSSFLQLTNVMPNIGGAFLRRWGLNQQGADITNGAAFQRMFAYAAAADTTFIGSVDTRILFATDGQNVVHAYDEVVTGSTFTIPSFSVPGDLWAVTSRSWFYAINGKTGSQLPWKQDFSQEGFVTKSNWGFNAPASMNITTPMGATVGSGTGYTSSPTVSFTGGGGSGAAATAFVSGGQVVNVSITNVGSGYTSVPTVVFTGGGGTGATFQAVINQNSASAYLNTVVAVVQTGKMEINIGRIYSIAFRNSVTGHTSDFVSAPGVFKVDTSAYNGYADPSAIPGNAPVIGAQQIVFHFQFSSAGVDPQVDTVLLMATSDGGDLEHQYEVAQIPLSTFTLGGGQYSLTYTDTLPDTYNDQYTAGSTLLTNNLWVDVLADGTVVGISENNPPPPTLNKPVIHQGRMFMTDGRSLYFSKSIDEVTTSTGLITSKWEESWPGSNVLDIAYDLETLNALLSDGTVLYIGSSDNIYRLLGSSASNFSIPETIFRGVGVQSQDAWTVVYKDNIPAGYTWVTTDGKIMLSDFNTYNEIGKPVHPLIPTGGINSVQSISYGPYSFAVYNVNTQSTPTWLIFDTKNNSWQLWERQVPSGLGGVPAPISLFSYTLASGVQRMFAMISGTVSSTIHNALQYFNPVATSDASLPNNSSANIPWTIETSWINLMDSASSTVINELEVWTQDLSTNVSVFVANSSSDLAALAAPVKTGPIVNGPLGTQKFYLAGSPTFGRYQRVRFFTDTATGLDTSNILLRQFQFEFFAQTRT